MDIYELVNKYISVGYSEDDAIPKVAQDIVLLKIGNSKYNSPRCTPPRCASPCRRCSSSHGRGT